MTNQPAVWVEGDPLMEAIAAAVWERCARDDVDMPQLVLDDPRNIAAAAASVVPPPTDRATLERVRRLHVPTAEGNCRECHASFDPCPTIAALDSPSAFSPGEGVYGRDPFYAAAEERQDGAQP